MKKFCLLIVCVGAVMSCGRDRDAGTQVPYIIFETDMGNDIDDAMALDMLYKYVDAGKARLLAVTINKEGTAPAEFVDIMGTWYGYPDVPVGIIRGGADCETDAVNYAKAVVRMKSDDGSPLFERSCSGYENYPDAYILYRKILAGMPDNSVTVVSVGFSTNLARLLETSADEYSPLSGKELVARKVKMLCAMGGCMSDRDFYEYNIVKDIESAKKVFEEWPTALVTSPFEVGIGIEFAVVALADNRQYRNFKHDGMQPRASYSDLNISIAALGACHAYRAALQMKEFEEIDKITFDEPQTSQIIQFFAAEMKRA